MAVVTSQDGSRTRAYLNANISVLNNTLITTGLQFPVAKNGSYYVKGRLLFTLAGITSGLKIGYAGGYSGSFRSFQIVYSPASGIVTFSSVLVGASTGSNFSTSLATTGNGSVEIEGVLNGGGTAGTFQLQYAQNTTDASNAFSLLAGSILIAERIQ